MAHFMKITCSGSKCWTDRPTDGCILTKVVTSSALLSLSHTHVPSRQHRPAGPPRPRGPAGRGSRPPPPHCWMLVCQNGPVCVNPGGSRRCIVTALRGPGITRSRSERPSISLLRLLCFCFAVTHCSDLLFSLFHVPGCYFQALRC